MSSEEQMQILKMVEEGKITPDEAMNLIKALDQPTAEDQVEMIDQASVQAGADDTNDEFEAVRQRAQRFTSIPLWAGTFFTVMAAFWMFSLVQDSNYGFWFVCAWFPLLLGILLIVLSSGGMNSRWLYVDVQQQPGEWPQRITFGFPLPLGIVSWGLRNFGHYASDRDRSRMDSLAAALEASKSMDEPIIVNVDEGTGGDRVQVFIG